MEVTRFKTPKGKDAFSLDGYCFRVDKRSADQLCTPCLGCCSLGRGTLSSAGPGADLLAQRCCGCDRNNLGRNRRTHQEAGGWTDRK